MALKAIIDFGFNCLYLHRISADYYAENIASGRIMQKSGMIFEGISKEKYFKFGTYHDVANYAIINPMK